MSAEPLQESNDTFLSRHLARLTSLVLRQPKAVILVAVGLAIASVIYAVFCLQFHTNRIDLLNPESKYNQRWLSYLEEFGDPDDAVIVLQVSEDADGVDTDLTVIIDEIADEIEKRNTHFSSVLYKKDLAQIRGKGLHFLSLEELEEIDSLVTQAEPILEGDWNQLRYEQLLSGSPIAKGNANNDPAATLGVLANSITNALNKSPTEKTNSSDFTLWGQANELDARMPDLKPEYLLSNQGQLGFLLVRMESETGGRGGDDAALNELRMLVADINERHASVSIGITGMPVLESDEMRSSQIDMTQASVLSLFGVALLFIAGFGGLRRPLLAVAVLLLALAWSFGFLTLAIGHLNLLSVAFGAILIGLGIDFGVHYIAQYLEVRKDTDDCKEAIRRTAFRVGPGVVTGGITTALAFFTASLTHFVGVAELGIIAGGGIILCMIGTLLVLPAMLYLSDRRETKLKVRAKPLPVGKVLDVMTLQPKAVLAIGCALSVLLAVGALGLRYDHNLLNLQPTSLESVQLEREILTNSDRSVWFALSVADDPSELLQRKAAFEQLDCVEHTEEIVSLLPESDAQKIAIIERIQSRLQNLPQTPPTIAMSSPVVVDRQLAGALQNLANSGRLTESTSQQIQTARQQLRATDTQTATGRLADQQMLFAQDLLARMNSLRELADPAPPSLPDVPDSLRHRFVGENGKHLLRVYARGDIWDMDELSQFVAAVETVDPNVTGHPVQTYYASRQMQQSYIHAAIYSLLAVAMILMVDFRSVRTTLLALFPMLLGMVQLLGVLGVLGISLNPANMIVLPLILGIGIDDGVHVMHDYRRQRSRYRLGNSTASAVLITSLTTMVGFGMMIFSRHQGLRSLGQVLTIGVFFCLVNSLVLLPALLKVCGSFANEQLEENSAAQPVLQIAEGTQLEAEGSSADDALADDNTTENVVVRKTVIVRRRAA